MSTDNRLRWRWISLTKTLGYDAALFEKAALALARFVAAEPEGHNQDSAARHFGEFFQLHLSGTRATPEARRDVIRRMAASENCGIRGCASLALDSLLEATHFRSCSHHDFGARPRDFGWRPQIHREVWDWYNAGIALAVELSGTLPVVRHVLAGKVRGIWRHAPCHDALEAASIELARSGSWIDGWIGFRNVQFYAGKGMPAETRARLKIIIERLKPADMLNRARATVLARSGGGLDLLDSEADDPLTAWRLAEQQAVDLGRTFANDLETLAAFLPELLAAQNPHRAFEFGRGLAKGADDISGLWQTLLASFKDISADSRNPMALGGYLHGAAGSSEFVAAALDAVADDPDVAGNLTYLQARAGIDRKAIARLSEALDAGKIVATDFRHLASGVVCEAPGNGLALLLAKLGALPGGRSIALEILHMCLACTKDDGRDCNPVLIECGRKLLAGADIQDNSQRNDYVMGKVVEVCLAGREGEEAAQGCCERIRKGLDSYALSAYDIGSLLQALFAVQPNIALDVFLLGDGDLEIRLERCSPINEMDTAVLRGWANVDPETRYPRVGQALPIFKTRHLDDAVGLSGKFLELLEHAPNRAMFLGSSRSSIVPSSWSGSLADVLERRRALLASLATHHDFTVKTWHIEIDAWLAEWISEERLREAEREESFE